MALSDALVGGWGTDRKGRRVCTSRFNPAWLGELGIDPAVIFDVGSYDGADALRLKDKFPKAIVVSVEGDPIRAAAIRKSLVGEDIIFIEAAISDEVGTVEWYQGGDRSEFGSKNGSIFRWIKKPVREPDKVPCTTLAAICAARGIIKIDLIHMDVEGAELFAMRGLGTIQARLVWAEVANAWPDAPGPIATHAEFLSMGYIQIAAAGSDRLYLRDGRC